jgi:hypothetical protein
MVLVMAAACYPKVQEKVQEELDVMTEVCRVSELI